MKTALVTGAKGFVGSHFVHRLGGNGWNVTGIDIPIDARMIFEYETKQFDLVIHAAAAGPNRKAIDTQPMNFAYNVMLDSALFDWVHRTRQPHIVYLSSCAVYSPDLNRGTFGPQPFVERQLGLDPFDNYGWTKRIGERMAATLNETGGTFVTVVRPFSGYGAKQSDLFPFRALLNRALNREDPFKIWGTGRQVRDWIHISDIVRGTMTLVEAKSTRPINLCTGIGTSMIDLVSKITQRVGYDPIIACDPSEPNGVDYRVGNTVCLNEFYVPKITINEGIDRALKGYS